MPILDDSAHHNLCPMSTFRASAESRGSLRSEVESKSVEVGVVYVKILQK